jgi:hypothetical protein
MAQYNEDRKIWDGHEWASRRKQYSTYKAWYDGTPLDETMERTDASTGKKVRKFPLGINLPKLGCDIHRDLARGVPDHDVPLVIQSTVERKSSDDAEALEEMINRVWRKSYGAAIQQEGMLDMNVYGGVSYMLRWEPWNRHLPWRFAVRKIPSPANILPSWSQFDPWRMSQCYIGFMISRREAIEKYNVSVDDTVQDVLYLEYWDRSKWWVRVHGQVPSMTWGDDEWELDGRNSFGFVPIYYIPHERTTKMFGDSTVEGQRELTRDFNSRAANVSDIVRATRPGLLTGHDLSRRKLIVKPIEKDGVIVGHYIDLGDTRNIQGAQPPELNSLPIPETPDSLIEFPSTILSWWMMVKRIAPAAFGMDDTQSGRITGPATAQRMWTSTAHCATERINYTTGKCLMDQDIIAGLRAKSDALRDMGLMDQEMLSVLGRNESLDLDIKQRWPPMIPLDKQQLHEELISELREGGASIERYLRAKGVEDVDGEKEKIMEWLEWLAEMEAKSQPAPQQGGQV